MICLIIFSHFFVCLVSFFNLLMGRNGIYRVYCRCLLRSQIFFFIIIVDVCVEGRFLIYYIDSWIEVENFEFSWCFFLDSFGLGRLFLINFISRCVFIYVREYLESDANIFRFVSIFALFSFFRLILVTAGNLLQLFIGWEGVGISSFLLVNFWYRRLDANKAGIKALLFNRRGDFGFFVFLILFLLEIGEINLGSLEFLFYHNNIYLKGISLMDFVDFISLCILLAASGKSAQYGFHLWLLDAREGPTPVSALLHSATRVTAGVFLVLRLSFILVLSNFCLVLLSFIGILTVLIGSVGALGRFDIKKITAFSSVSQLGFRRVACGSLNFSFGFFHLIIHAFFKALLFLSCGIIIFTYSKHEQDLRLIGNLDLRIGIVGFFFVIALLGLSGFPFSSGFYSKEFVLQSYFWGIGNFLDIFISGGFFLGSLFTIIYCLIFLIGIFYFFSRRLNGSRFVFFNIIEPSFYLILGPLLFSIFTIVGGFYFGELLILGGLSNRLGLEIFFFFGNFIELDIEFFSRLILFTILFVILFISIVLYFIFLWEFGVIIKQEQKILFELFKCFYSEFYINFYYSLFAFGYLDFAYRFIIKVIDRGFLEWWGPFGIFYFFYKVFCFYLNFSLGIFFFYYIFIVFFLGLVFISIFFNLNIGLTFLLGLLFFDF